jgi:hypothetical protein
MLNPTFVRIFPLFAAAQADALDHKQLANLESIDAVFPASEMNTGIVNTRQTTLKGEKAKPDMPNSINSLSPSDKLNIALSSIPLPKNIIFQFIMGDRGKDDLPNSSDGVVQYGASHVDTPNLN